MAISNLLCVTVVDVKTYLEDMAKSYCLITTIVLDEVIVCTRAMACNSISQFCLYNVLYNHEPQ